MFKELIWVKKHSLTKTFCDSVIEKFENEPRKTAGVIGSDCPRVDKSIKDTTDITITNISGWEKEDQTFFKALSEGLKEYQEYLQTIHHHCIPNPNYTMKDAGYKLQKYEPNGFYNWHNDWCINEIRGSRVFVFMWYLNTIKVEDDGYTEFFDGSRFQPECGSLLFFPATWTYVHRGKRPKVCKYLCNGWIYAK